MRNIGILDGCDFSREAISRLQSMGTVEVYADGPLKQFLENKQIIFVRLTPQIDAAFLSLAPRLQIIVSPTTGLNHIDQSACAQRNIIILSLKGRTDFLNQISATPEHALGLIIALLRNYNRALLSPENKHWDRNKVRGHDLKGKRVGILGLGRVGQKLARALHALDATVFAYDPKHNALTPHEVILASSPHELAKQCDILVVAASHEPQTPPIVDAAMLDLLAEKYFVNIARGELVDEQALLDRVARGHFAGVAIDVLANETSEESRLDEFVKLTPRQNVIVTPHIGGATFESSEATELHLVDVLAERLEHGT